METSLSGSHLGPHRKRIARSVQQGRLQRSSLFLVHALLRRLLLLQPQFTTATIDDEDKYSLPRRGSHFKGLGSTEARPPVARLSPERRDSQHHDLVFTHDVHDGELELAGKDATSTELVAKASFCKLRCQCLSVLNCLVESPAKAWADVSEVLNLVEELCTSFLDVSNGFHRWKILRASAWTSAADTSLAVPDSTAFRRR